MNISEWLVVLLTVLFIGLKLTGYITWSWVWVLSPLWIGLCISLGIAIVAGIIVGLVYWSGAK